MYLGCLYGGGVILGEVVFGERVSCEFLVVYIFRGCVDECFGFEGEIRGIVVFIKIIIIIIWGLK